MKRKLFFLILGLFCSLKAFTQVVINELDSDTPGTDVLEFVELKSSTPNFALDGYVLVFFNAGNNNTAYLSYDLDGLVTDANGIVTLGNTALSPAPDRNINDNVIQNGPDAVAIYLGNPSNFINGTTQATTTNLIDALIHETADPDPTSLMNLLGETVSYDESINGNPTGESIQRKNDGTYETKTPTPDVPNDGSGTFNYLRTTISPIGDQTEPNSFTITFTLDNIVSGSDMNFTYALVNGTFDTADYTGSLFVTIPIGSKTASKTINLVDDSLDEGDETMIINVGSLPAGYTIFNNNIEVRIHDNDYVVQPWGTPLNPTYGLAPRIVPTGYYDSLEGKSGNQLKQAIQDIIANPAIVREHTYADVWDILREADTNPANSSQVWLMYVEHPSSKLDQQTGTSGAIGKWNREHIYCQSRGAFNLDSSAPNDGIDVWLPTDADDITAGGADGHHIRAEDSPENSSRNNKNYGVDPSGTDDYNGPSGNAGSWRGDVSRAIFYMCVRYNGLNVVNGFPSETPTGYIGDLATLLVWNKNDKADDYEMNRNNVIYNWQKNRNPFIDYPLLVDYVFGDKFGQTWNAALANENFNQLDIVMYPNPSNGTIQIAGLTNVANLEVFNITGQLIFKTNYEPESRIDLSLSSGVYLIKIKEGNKTATKKLIIR